MQNYPKNPRFGQGNYQRRIRIENQGQTTVAELEDCNHAFRLTITRSDNRITSVSSESLRTPLTTCQGAEAILQQALVGVDCGQSFEQLSRVCDAKQQCTHLLDLAYWAILHSQRAEVVRDYWVVIPDEVDNKPTHAQVFRNGKEVLAADIQKWQIITPKALSDKPLYKGFKRWLFTLEDAEHIEAWSVLQKGYFVAQAREMDIDKLEGEPASNHSFMLGACYSYSEPVVFEAKRAVNSVRDFTDASEQLLKFS